MMSSRNLGRSLLVRLYSGAVGGSSGSPAAAASASTIPDTPGLSEACVHKAKGPVGPGVDPAKTGEYKVPEYFCYDNMSYFEAEIEMSKYRLPQPDAEKK